MQNMHPKVIFAENKYGAYFIPDGTEHRLASAAILRGDVWEPETITFMREHHANADIIHAGTFFGDFLPALSSVMGENTIWAFEPNPENYFCAMLTQKINHLNNVRLHNAGLGAQAGTLPQKHYCSRKQLKAGGGSRIYQEIPKNKPAHDFQDVAIVRGADVVDSKRISIIHLDVEGFEQYALAGLMPLIHTHQPILLLETLPSEEFMKENLYSLGYKFSHKVDENSVFTV